MVEYIDVKKEDKKRHSLNKGLYYIHLMGIICGVSGCLMIYFGLQQRYILMIVFIILFIGNLPPLSVDNYSAIWGFKRK